jgi:hypothetical protein
MTFDEMRERHAEERDLDESLRRALTEERLDVSRVLKRVRTEMRSASCTRAAGDVGGPSPGGAVARPGRFARSFLNQAIAAALLIVIVSGVLMFERPRILPIAAEAACDHYDELVRLEKKKWHTAPADVAVYVNRHFPAGGDLARSLTPPGASFEKVGTCRLQGERFIHFVYRSGPRNISVFVRLSEPGEAPLPHLDYHDDRRGLQVAGFNTARYEGLVVTTLPSAPTQRIADQLAQRL